MTKSEMQPARYMWLTVLMAVTTVLLTGCGDGGATRTADAGDAAARTYVAPGEMDEYYLFYSGGHGGDVRVAGIPSMRHIKTIPVFLSLIHI